jgi:hydroxymethylpyrimidine pyrophosphatase-like HAD family hydrolase
MIEDFNEEHDAGEGVDTQHTAEYWENRFLMLQQEHTNLQQVVNRMNEQMEDISITLEVANERWVSQVNENTSLEVALRKLKKKV